MVLAEYARTCADVLCTLSVVLVLVCRPVCGVQEIGSVSLSASSLDRKYCQLVYWEMTSGNCLRIPVNLRSLFEEVHTFPT